MNARIHLSGLFLVAAAWTAPLSAQLVRVPLADESRRVITFTGDVGLLSTGSRYDAIDGGSWLFSEAIAYRVGLDVALSAGSLGIIAVTSRVPMYRSGVINSDGDITFRQLAASIRSPEGQGAHQVIEITVGWAQWADYRGSDPISEESEKARNAAILAIGYGFAFPIGSRATFTFVQDAGLLIGSGEDIPANASRTQTQYHTRIGLRLRVAGSR